jgi:hypothetical protein
MGARRPASLSGGAIRRLQRPALRPPASCSGFRSSRSSRVPGGRADLRRCVPASRDTHPVRTMGGAGRAFLQRWRTTRDGVIWSAHSATAIRWTADIICGPWLLVSGAWLRAAQGDSEAAHVGGDQRGDVQHAGGAARGVHPEQADKINLGASWPFNRAVGPIKSFHSPYALPVTSSASRA